MEYAIVDGKVQTRALEYHVADHCTRSWTRYFAAAYVRHYRGSTTDERIIRQWAHVPAFPAEYSLRKAFTVEASGTELSKTLAALGAYRSQMPDLFTNEKECRELYGNVAETLYRVSRKRG